MERLIGFVKLTLTHVWYKYKMFVQRAVEGAVDNRSALSWRDRLFTICIIYSIPFSLLALIPSMIIAHQEGYHLIPVFDVFTITSIIVVTLNKRFTIAFRKTYVVAMFYLLAIILFAYLGAFGIGSIYLLAVCVFISLLFPKRVIYSSIVLNFVIYTAFAAIIYFKLFDSPLIVRYSTGFWIAYSSNFLFLNMVVVLQIRHVITGLERTNVKNTNLLNELQAELDEKALRNQQLKESEGHYRSLFFMNPSPMWIYDTETLRFLQVNDAAIVKYGFSEEEFLSMCIKDIRPAEMVDDLLDTLHGIMTHKTSITVTKHRLKEGEEIYTEVSCSTIPFKGKDARLVIARDITAQIEHTLAIEKQNNKLQEIAYLQSHVVRAPLARILALTDIVTHDGVNAADGNIITYLDTSAKELDDVIRAIVSRTEQIVPVVKDHHQLQKTR